MIHISMPLYREELFDLREKLLEAEAHRLNGVKTYSIDEVNERLEEIIKRLSIINEVFI